MLFNAGVLRSRVLAASESGRARGEDVLVKYTRELTGDEDPDSVYREAERLLDKAGVLSEKSVLLPVYKEVVLLQ